MKYIFLHIPKNGGTTLQSIVDAQYRKYEIYNIPDPIRKEAWDKLKTKSNFSKHFIKVVKGGHFKYGCHRFFSNPNDVKYFAMLRNPIDRAYSYYAYVKRTPIHYLHDIIISEDLSFEAFIDRTDLNMEITNGQTKIIAGIDQKDNCSATEFEMAKGHLKKSFFLVGIMEKYVETLFALKTMLNWSKPINYNVLNVNKNSKYEISTDVKEKLMRINRFDIEIYNEYQRLFEKKVSSFVESDYNAFKNSLH